MEALSGKKFAVTESLLKGIYDNSVFPTQGTRPVFSAIHMMFSSLLMEVAFWMIEENLSEVTLDLFDNVVLATADSAKEQMFSVDMRLSEQRAKITNNFRSMVAVHEAGHAVAYAVRKKAAPFEVKVNLTSFTGGYMANAVPSPYKIETKATIMNDIIVLLAGRAAEEMVFGEENASSGAESDITEATKRASHYTRRWGFGKTIGRIETASADRISWITKVAESDVEVIALLQEAYSEAHKVLAENREYFIAVVKQLIRNGVLKQDEYIQISKPFMNLGKEERTLEHSEKWVEFERLSEVEEILA